MRKGDDLDPRGLIQESYRIDGITAAECRSIFMDWALGTPAGADVRALIGKLVAQYADDHPDHPMTGVLRAGLETPQRPVRRGGWAGRRRDNPS